MTVKRSKHVLSSKRFSLGRGSTDKPKVDRGGPGPVVSGRRIYVQKRQTCEASVVFLCCMLLPQMVANMRRSSGSGTRIGGTMGRWASGRTRTLGAAGHQYGTFLSSQEPLRETEFCLAQILLFCLDSRVGDSVHTKCFNTQAKHLSPLLLYVLHARIVPPTTARTNRSSDLPRCMAMECDARVPALSD